MPAGLARSGVRDDPRPLHRRAAHGVFKPEVEVGADASAQDRLLAYTGRAPASP